MGKRAYRGQCHCGRVVFEFQSEAIQRAMRCNCSICRRKNAIMTAGYCEPGDFRLLSGEESLGIYRFGDGVVNHHFCKSCGIHTFHNGDEQPGVYRINLCCVDEIDPHELGLRVFDGRDTWKYL